MYRANVYQTFVREYGFVSCSILFQNCLSIWMIFCKNSIRIQCKTVLRRTRQLIRYRAKATLRVPLSFGDPNLRTYVCPKCVRTSYLVKWASSVDTHTYCKCSMDFNFFKEGQIRQNGPVRLQTHTFVEYQTSE